MVIGRVIHNQLVVILGSLCFVNTGIEPVPLVISGSWLSGLYVSGFNKDKNSLP